MMRTARTGIALLTLVVVLAGCEPVDVVVGPTPGAVNEATFSINGFFDATTGVTPESWISGIFDPSTRHLRLTGVGLTGTETRFELPLGLELCARNIGLRLANSLPTPETTIRLGGRFAAPMEARVIVDMDVSFPTCDGPPIGVGSGATLLLDGRFDHDLATGHSTLSVEGDIPPMEFDPGIPIVFDGEVALNFDSDSLIPAGIDVP